MRENLNYYLALPSVVKEDVVDLEAKVQWLYQKQRYWYWSNQQQGVDEAVPVRSDSLHWRGVGGDGEGNGGESSSLFEVSAMFKENHHNNTTTFSIFEVS